MENIIELLSNTESKLKHSHESRDVILELIFLIFSRWRSLSYKNQSIDLLCKPMEWFLYDKEIRHEKVNDSYVMIAWKPVTLLKRVSNTGVFSTPSHTFSICFLSNSSRCHL